MRHALCRRAACRNNAQRQRRITTARQYRAASSSSISGVNGAAASVNSSRDNVKARSISNAALFGVARDKRALALSIGAARRYRIHIAGVSCYRWRGARGGASAHQRHIGIDARHHQQTSWRLRAA